MELLTVKNNIINYSNLKKVRFFFFHFIYKLFVLCGAVLALLAALISVFNDDMFDFIKSSLVLVILCILPFVQSEVMLKRFIKLQKEKKAERKKSLIFKSPPTNGRVLYFVFPQQQF